MRPSEPLRVFPFSPGGAAFDTALPAPPPSGSGEVALHDFSARPRFGLKGAGSTGWLTGQGIPIPQINRFTRHGSMRVLRLGREDILLVAEETGGELEQLVAAWRSETGPKGYSAWREEGWAWMRLSGSRVEAAMARLCALDLRPGHFGPDELAQTRVAELEAVLVRVQDGYDLFFDITMSAYFARAVTAATANLGLG